MPLSWTDPSAPGIFSIVTPDRSRRIRPIRRIDLRKTLFLLPNLVTLASVFCGFNAILILSQPNVGSDTVGRAAMLLLFAMLFDLLDGRVARMTKTQSSFGLELDSLADVLSRRYSLLHPNHQASFSDAVASLSTTAWAQSSS